MAAQEAIFDIEPLFAKRSERLEEINKVAPAEADFAKLTTLTNKALWDRYYTGDAIRPNQSFYSSLSDRNQKLSAWDMGQVLEATLSTDKLNDDRSRSDELNKDLNVMGNFWDQRSKPPAYSSMYGPSGDKYYDDNSWIGIAMVDSFRQFHNKSDLYRATQVHEFNEHGTRGTEKLAHPGGVLWTQQKDNLYRATVSTAGATQLALELYQETRDQKYLDFAQKQHDWVNANLRDSNGLYYDGMDADGKLHKEQYTYNQGLMLGNAALLYKATGDEKYLKEAQEIAGIAVKNFAGGTYPEPFKEQLLFFNAVFFKNLCLLDEIAPDASYKKVLGDYARILAPKVDAQTGLIKDDGKMTLLDQTSAIQIFALAQKHAG